MKKLRKTLATIISFMMCFTLLTNVAHAEELAPVISDYVGEISEKDADSDLIVTEIESDEVNVRSFEDSSGEDSLMLLEEYINYKVDRHQTPAFYSSSFAGDKLSGINKTIYDKAKIAISEVANGKRESTQISFSFEELGCSGMYSAADLGVAEIMASGSISTEDMNALDSFTGIGNIDLKSVAAALRADCPYERYWMGFDTSLSGYSYSAQNNGGEWKIGYAGELIFGIGVSGDYAGASDFTVDTSITGAVNSAINTVNTILDNANSKTDDGKIEYFRDEICTLNSYNYDVLSWDEQQTIDNYGDPWQLVYVFDGNPDTKTVCEGYSKAFMFLCNKTFFSSSAINCYVVTGDMDGEGHMWNIIHWSDNNNYMVDVTNCDSLGTNDLFKATPASGTYASGYYFRSGSNQYFYVYDEDTKNIYSENELSFGIDVYGALTDIIVNYDAYIVSGKSVSFTIVREGGTEACQFRLDSAVDASSVSILGDYTPTYGDDNIFYITFPSEGKYTIQFSAKDSDNAEVSKTITVDVKKSSGITTYDELVTALNNASTDENAPTEIVLDADINTEAQLTVKANTYVILDLNGHVINRGGTGSRVMINNGCLTITDSKPDTAHSPEITYTDPTDDTNTISVSGGVIMGGYSNEGAGIYVSSTGKLILNGGTIANNIIEGTSNNGGGVYIYGGKFIMNGGAICGNKAGYTGGGVMLYDADMEMNDGLITCNSVNYNQGDGGGIYVSNGSELVINDGEISRNYSSQGGGIGIYYNATVTMNGGKISNNKTFRSDAGGGGVNAYDANTFTMLGGEISNNISAGYGGGVNMNGVDFSMSGDAVIKNNTAFTYGGGVYIKNGGVITLSGNALIEENTASSDGGGVYVESNGNLHISGKPVISGNKKGTDDNNVAGFFSLDGALTSGASIGVTYGTPTPGNCQIFNDNFTTYNNLDDPVLYFTSDNPSYVVGINGSGVALFAKCTISFDADGGSGEMSSISDYFGAYTLPECGFTAPEGKKFKAWSISGKEYSVSSVIKVEDNITIKAVWDTIPSYTVTYDVNGGDAIDQTVYTIQENNQYGEMPVTSRLGYTFEGWYTDSENGDKVESTDLVTGSITLYAHWSLRTDIVYKVEHYKETTSGSFYSWPDKTDTLKGKAFSNVTPDVNVYDGFISPDTQTVEINPDGSTVVKYKYYRKTHTITWDFNGGTVNNSYTSGTVKYGAYITRPNLTKPGYVFLGWDKEVPTNMPDEDLSYVARFSTNVWIGGIEITEENSSDLTAAINEAAGSTVATGTARYDFSNRTLYFENFNYIGAGYEWSANRRAGLYVTERELNIIVSGTNSIVQHKASVGDRDWCYGYYQVGGSTLSITGSGSLLFKADAVDDTKWNSYGLRKDDSGDVYVSGVDLKIVAEPVQNISRGLYFYDYGDLTLKNNATIECAAGTNSAYYSDRDDDAGYFSYPSGYYYLTGEALDGSDSVINTTVKDWACYLSDYKYFKLTYTDLFIGGLPINEKNSDDIVSAINTLFPDSATGQITYDKDEHTITLNNFNLLNKNTAAYADEYHCGICYTGSDDLTVNVIGDNSIISSSSKYDHTAGIYSQSANLDFLGDGSLTVTGANVGSDIDSYGICSNGTVTFDGPTVEVISGDVNRYYSTGIYGTVHLKSGKLTVRSGSAGNFSYYEGYTYGIYGKVTVDDGELNVYGGTAKASEYSYSYGIDGCLTVNNGTVNISSGESTSGYYAYSEGVYGDITLNNGTINVTSGDCKAKEGSSYDYTYSYGINGEVTVYDGILNVNTGNSLYYCDGIDDDLIVKGGKVTVTTGKAKYCSGVDSATVDGGTLEISTGDSLNSSVGVYGTCKVNGGNVTITTGDSDDTCRGTGTLYVYGGNTEINTGKGAKNNYGVSSINTYSGNVKIVAEDATENSFAINGYTYFSGGVAELISKGTGNAAKVINYSYISIDSSKSGIDIVSRNSDGSSPEEYNEDNLSQYKYLKTSTAYGLRVADKVVTSANCTDVFGDGKVSFDPSTETLKLNGVSLEASQNYAVIYISEGYLKNLNVEVSGQNTLTYKGTTSEACGIFSYGNINVKFAEGAKLDIRSTEITSGSSYVGARANGLTVDGKGTLNIYGRQFKDCNGSTLGLRVGTKLVLSNNATLNIYGGDYIGTDDSYHTVDCTAIWTYEGTNIEIGDGCTLNASTGANKSGNNSGRRIGLYYSTSGTITLKGSGTANIKVLTDKDGKESSTSAFGIYLYCSSYYDTKYCNIESDSWTGSFTIESRDYAYVSQGGYYSNNVLIHDPDKIDIIFIRDSDNNSMYITESEYNTSYLSYNKMIIRPHKTYNVTVKAGEGMTPVNDYNDSNCICLTNLYFYADTANEYYFAEDYAYEKNGIKIRRMSDKYIIVSGVPTADTVFNVPTASYDTYNVVFDANKGGGKKPTEAIKQRSSYTLPKANTFTAPAGYVFDKWEVKVGKAKAVNKKPGDKVTISANTKVKALWKASTNTPYKVEHYKQGTDGNYTAKPEIESFTGTTDTEVTPAVKSYDGYISPEKQTAAIKGDGSLVIKYYYEIAAKEKTQEELVTDFVKRFYKEVLNRPQKQIDADTDGIADWVDRLISGRETGAQVAYGFVYSAEFRNRNVNDEDFVTIMYYSFFGREPDISGYNDWIEKLKNGTDRYDVLAGFTNSQEFRNLCAEYNINPGKLEKKNETPQPKPQPQNTNQKPPLKLDASGVDPDKLDEYVERLYKEILGRESEAEGKAYWKQVIIDGKDSEGREYDAATAARKGFFESKEYKNKERNDDEFLNDLYHAFFDRDPDEEGYAYWQNKMKNEGYSRQRVIDEGFGHSLEFKNLLKSYGFVIIE